MVLPAASRVVGRAALRASLTGTTSAARLGAAVPAASSALRSRVSPVVASSLLLRRSLSSSPNSRSIIPDAEHPAPKQSEASDSVTNTQPTDISLSEYHEHADRYLELLQQKLEDKQDAGEGARWSIR